MGKGPSYIPHYKNGMEFFHDIGATFLVIPCNTAHKRLDEYCVIDTIDMRDRVIDIRKAILDKNTQTKNMDKK